jgi:hypothetical protein
MTLKLTAQRLKNVKEKNMDRRDFLKTLAAGSMMVMLPSLAKTLTPDAALGLKTVDDLTAWMEGRYECYMGEARGFMCLNQKGLEKYDLTFNDLPVETNVWNMDNKVAAANIIYSTVAFAVEENNPVKAEQQLVQALKEKFEEVAPQTLIWRVKPEFTSDKMTEYGNTWATREQIDDKLMDHLGMPADVEYDFISDSYKHVKRRYVLNKLRMRLALPKQLAEDYEDLTVVSGSHPKRI